MIGTCYANVPGDMNNFCKIRKTLQGEEPKVEFLFVDL